MVRLSAQREAMPCHATVAADALQESHHHHFQKHRGIRGQASATAHTSLILDFAMPVDLPREIIVLNIRRGGF